jgi:hypothetical protein
MSRKPGILSPDSRGIFDKNEKQQVKTDKVEEISELDQMKEMLVNMQSKLDELQSNNQQSQGEIQEQKKEEIRPDRYVKIMSGLNQILNLPRLSGKDPFRFTRFGEIKRVTFQQLVDILEKKEAFYLKGFFHILDKEVVEHLGYADLQTLLPGQIEMVVDNTCPTESALELYRQGTEAQKGIIVDMLIAKIRDGKEVNMNLIYAIERESKIKIVEQAERAKEFMEMGVP